MSNFQTDISEVRRDEQESFVYFGEVGCESVHFYSSYQGFIRLSAELQAVSNIFIPKLQEYLRSEFETKTKAKANAELSLNCAVQGTFLKNEI